MSVTRGNKGSCPTNDQSLVGVYQNGTYTISGSAKIESGSSTQNNSIYLPSGKYVNQSGAIRNTFLITTATNDRKVGRELVQF